MATDTRANTHHDVLWDGATLYVASYRFVNDGLPAEPNFPTTMRRYSYNPSSKTYTLLSSEQINNQRVETLTIDKDSTGRVWATWQQGNKIFMNVTNAAGVTWGTPFQHPASLSNVSVDDTSALIAFDGKMGVLWSRQVGDATDGMYWSYHVDGASNTSWSTPEAAVQGQRSGDDHMNLKWLDSSGGRVFAAIKTSFTSASEPLIQLLSFNGSTWSVNTIATVSECPNRVLVLIDEGTQRLRTFATYPKPSGTTNAGVCTSSGGAIYEKSTPLDNINFTTTKTARIVDADQYVHNVTSTKQNLNSTAWGTANSGVLLLADVNATNRYWNFYEPGPGGGGGDTTAPTVTATSPSAGATGVAVSANVTGTFSEAMDASTVTSGTFTLTTASTAVPAAVSYNSANNAASLNPTADLAAGTTYTATIKGGSTGVKDAAGNPLASDRTWTFTTASAGVTPGAVVFADMDGTKDDTYTIPTAEGVEYLVGGTVKAAGSYPGTGTVTVTARATDGYVLQAGATTEWATTFKITPAPYTPPAVSPFADVSTDQLFYKEMSWLAARGISSGWTESNGTRSYRALQPVNRDAMAAFLYRFAGSPTYTPPAVSPFADVSTDQLFYKEMSWLAARGISSGWTESNGTRTYRALQPVNRDAMAAFLYRFAGSPTYTPPAVSPFADVSTDQLFYKEMSWLAAQGISSGWTESNGTRTYRALQPVNRDAMAAFLHRAAGTP